MKKPVCLFGVSKMYILFRTKPWSLKWVALARKISGGSSKDLPPSYSRTDLTHVGLTVDDHLNPPPSYDRYLNLIDRERKTGVRLNNNTMSRFSVSSTSSLASTNFDHVVDIENHNPSRRSSSRVHFAPILETGPTERKRPTSLPLVSVLVKPESRKGSTQSEGGEPEVQIVHLRSTRNSGVIVQQPQ